MVQEVRDKTDGGSSRSRHDDAPSSIRFRWTQEIQGRGQSSTRACRLQSRWRKIGSVDFRNGKVRRPRNTGGTNKGRVMSHVTCKPSITKSLHTQLPKKELPSSNHTAHNSTAFTTNDHRSSGFATPTRRS